MCGITGVFDIRGRREISRAVLTRMNESQHHRGPDEGSIHIEPGLGFGHRRLSIIDVATGQQPLFNEDGSVCVVFNGEIYNFQELVPELQVLGHEFRTHSDTEVIVHAWEQWGEACVERFRGMFAFALWDRNRETLFLARDRLGVKPLFYALLDDGCLLFGSELKSLMAHGGLRRDVDPFAVEEILRARLRCRTAVGVPGRAQASARAHAAGPARPAVARRARVLGCAVHHRPCHHARGRLRGTLRAPARLGSPAHDLRGAAGRVPFGRRRLECRGRRDGGAFRRAGEHLFDCVR